MCGKNGFITRALDICADHCGLTARGRVVDMVERNATRRSSLAVALGLLVVTIVSGPVLGHGSLASGEGHDDPTLAELMLTPIVVGIIHVLAMVALLVLAYRARATGSAPDLASGTVPEEAEAVFDQFMKEDDRLDHAFRPNRRMYMVSKNLPHFFVLTGLATFFSIYTYQWLGDNTVWVYTTVHASAIVVLFVHSALGWRNTWYGVSPRALYTSFGTLSPLAISMPLRDLESIEVRKSRLKGMLDVSSLRLEFTTGKQRTRVGLTMRAIDSPDRIREVIMDEAGKPHLAAA